MELALAGEDVIGKEQKRGILAEPGGSVGDGSDPTTVTHLTRNGAQTCPCLWHQKVRIYAAQAKGFVSCKGCTSDESWDVSSS